MRARILALLLAISAPSFAGEPLENAAREAAALCDRVNAETISRCGSLGSKGPELSAARRAVGKMFEARAEFMRNCEVRARLGACTSEADWLMLSGLSSANSKQ